MIEWRKSGIKFRDLSLFLISMSGGVLSTAEQPKPIIKEEVKNDRGCCKSSNWKDN